MANLGFPLKDRPDTPKTYASNQVKRRIMPPTSPAVAGPQQLEPTLDTTNYERILSIVSNMGIAMEQSPKAYKGMGEEDLRHQFLVQLNGQYEGNATGETFNKQGKTDILIRDQGRNIFIAECKVWSGPSGLVEALDQLLGYLSWRDTKTALLVFNRTRNMSTVLKKIPETVKGHPNYKATIDLPMETGFRYVFRHRDDNDRELILTVLAFRHSANDRNADRPCA